MKQFLVVFCGVLGRHRAGMKHPPLAQYPLDHFTADQLADMRCDPVFHLAIGEIATPEMLDNLSSMLVGGRMRPQDHAVPGAPLAPGVLPKDAPHTVVLVEDASAMLPGAPVLAPSAAQVLPREDVEQGAGQNRAKVEFKQEPRPAAHSIDQPVVVENEAHQVAEEQRREAAAVGRATDAVRSKHAKGRI